MDGVVRPPFTARRIANVIKELGYSTRADAYSRAKGRPHVKVEQYPTNGPVHVTVALAEVTMPSELDDRAEDAADAAYMAMQLQRRGYLVDIDKKCPWIFSVIGKNL